MARSRATRFTAVVAGVMLATAPACRGENASPGTTGTLAPVALRPPGLGAVTEPPVVTAGATTTSSVVATTLPVVETTSTTSSSTTSTTTTTTVPPTPVTITFTGEVWPQTGVVRAATPIEGVAPNFTPQFAEIAPHIAAADLAVCHLETPVAPAELIAGLAGAGYDRCSTASERTFEGGVEAVNATASVFDDNGMTQSGLARTPDETRPVLLEVKGIRIAHLSYTFRHEPRPPVGEEWRAAVIDVPRIVADATTARQAGAELVILSVHWGNADSARPNPQQREWADQLTASGVIDLIVGTHSHVLQPIEQVNGVWVAFSLGNSLTYMPTNEQWSRYTQDGVVATFTVTRNADGRPTVSAPSVRPTFVDKVAGCIIRDVSTILADPAGFDPALVKAATDSLGRTTQILGTAFLATA